MVYVSACSFGKESCRTYILSKCCDCDIHRKHITSIPMPINYACVYFYCVAGIMLHMPHASYVCSNSETHTCYPHIGIVYCMTVLWHSSIIHSLELNEWKSMLNTIHFLSGECLYVQTTNICRSTIINKKKWMSSSESQTEMNTVCCGIWWCGCEWCLMSIQTSDDDDTIEIHVMMLLIIGFALNTIDWCDVL